MVNPTTFHAVDAIAFRAILERLDFLQVAHLTNVAAILRANVQVTDQEVLHAAVLHDIFEDTETTSEELLAAGFTKRTVAIIQAVTDEAGANRAERHAKTYPKILACGADAVVVKLADRIANVGRCWETRDRRLFMYHAEYPLFRSTFKPLSKFKGPLMDAQVKLWTDLDKLMCWE